MIRQASAVMTMLILTFLISMVAAEIVDTENANLVESVESIMCFQCNSGKHPDCAGLTSADTNSTHYRECIAERMYKGKRPFCRKTIYTILNNKFVRINRECGWETYKSNTTRCYDVDTDFKYEVNCQCFSNGCNSAPQMSRQSFVRIFSISILLGLLILSIN